MTDTVPKPPRGWLRILFKLPVFIARMGFSGWEFLFGLEWMLLITTGRKSGKKRYAMVDVLLYDQKLDTYFIEVGFGKSSDWYRNIQANPHFEAQVRRRRFSAMAEELPPDKTGDMMVNFVPAPAGIRKIGNEGGWYHVYNRGKIAQDGTSMDHAFNPSTKVICEAALRFRTTVIRAD